MDPAEVEAPAPGDRGSMEPSSWDARSVNGFTLLGAALLFAGAFAYAVGEIAFVDLSGATDFFAYGWAFQAEGAGYILIGLGFFFAFYGLESGLPTIGGIAAGIGGILSGLGALAYAALRGLTDFSGLAFTYVLDALGHALLGVGLFLAFGGLAAVRIERRQGLFGRRARGRGKAPP